MYTATMEYRFKAEDFDTACRIWEAIVFKAAASQEGFIRMQLLVAPPAALAVGTWKTRENAMSFMETGVFKTLLDQLAPYLDGEPRPRVWDLLHFAEKQDF
jgi:hypothetical protein